MIGDSPGHAEPVPAWFLSLVLALAAVGIGFRLTNLGKKPYWYDETCTSMRIGGHTFGGVAYALQDGGEFRASEFLKFQRLHAGRNVVDTARSLARDNAHHPPGYYVIAHYWASLLGDSPTMIRALSVVISLLGFPAMYWLGMELFQSRRAAWAAVALLGISPFHLLYAQEARPYSLWVVVTLLSTAALLRALRRSSRSAWWVYAGICAVGFYTHLFFIFVAAAHWIYLVTRMQSETGLSLWRRPTLPKYSALSTLIPLILFAPWALIIFIKLHNVRAATEWLTVSLSPVGLFKAWVASFGTLLWDMEPYGIFAKNFHVFDIKTILTRWSALILAGVAFFSLYRTAEKRVWLAVFLLVGVPGLGLIVPDLLFGGRRSALARFWVPCYLGAQLAIAHFLAVQCFSRRPMQRLLWRAVGVLVVGSGVASCYVISQSDYWWNKYSGDEILNVAEVLHGANRPLVINDNLSVGNLGTMISLSHSLDPSVRLWLVRGETLPDFSDDTADVFIYRPSESILQTLKEKHGFTAVKMDSTNWLWRVVR